MIYNRQIYSIMRNKVLSFALASIMMSLGIPTCAQQSQSAMKAGDVFTGTVTGRFGPLAGANIREIGDEDYFNIELADSLGRFSMQINNPEHKFSVLSFPYEVLEIMPTSTPMEIKLETVRRGENGKPGPAYDAGGKYIKADYNYVSRQPVIPKEYICGYAVQPINYAEQRSWYGVFLHKDDMGYMVVLHYCGGGCADTIRIDDKLAERLSGSVELVIDRAPNEQYGGDEVDILHEGTNVYALIPGQAAVIWETEIPDRVWNRLYHQFGKNLGYKPVESRWIGSFDFGDGRVYTYPTMNNDGYAMTSFVNRLRYRYDIETGQAVVEYNKGSMPTGNLVIESSITVERKVWPVTAIADGALDNCTGVSSVSIPESVTSIGELAFRFCDLDSVKLGSVNPIGCPVNAFDESVYENAVLIVPKGWKQKKAAKVGPAWRRFKNIRYY